MNTLAAILIAIYAVALIGTAVVLAPSCDGPTVPTSVNIGHIFLGGCR